MIELNISSYIQSMQQGLVKNDKQESAARLLFNTINDQPYVKEHGFYTASLSSKKISLIVNGAAPVPDGIKQASAIPEVIKTTIDNFRKTVVPDLNPHIKEDTLDHIEKLIKSDGTVSESKRNGLLLVRKSEDEAAFLAQVFLYVINRPYEKRKDDSSIEVEDAPLLDEVNYECPLCHKKLVESIKGRPIKKYTITPIFPEELSAEKAKAFERVKPKPSHLDIPENLIALDQECSENYLIDPSVEEYETLLAIKKNVMVNYAAKTAISRFQLEDNIRTVIETLSNLSSEPDVIRLSYEALRIDEKFEEDNYILKTQTQFHVLTYYKYIESLFKEFEADFDMIAMEIKKCSQQLERSGLSQESVIRELSKWIRQQTKLSADEQFACDIVVSFFIQNCEVFYKDENSK